MIVFSIVKDIFLLYNEIGMVIIMKKRNYEKKLKLNNKGFTLIEVLAVVVIIAVLGLGAVTNVLKTMNKGKDSSYQILIEDIKIAGQQLFEELEFAHSNLYYYNKNGSTGNLIEIVDETTEATNNQKKISVNLQTLVSNGFLTGTNNDTTNSLNKNTKIILSPKTQNDIGECEIVIKKKVNKDNNYTTTYEFENQSESNQECPTTVEYRR